MWESSTGPGAFGCPKPSSGGVSRGRSKPIQSPYLDFATFARPRSFSDVIDWSEYVAQLTDDMWVGLNKLYGYFSTRILIHDNSSDIAPADVAHCKRWERLLHQTLQYPLEEIEMGLNVGVYGNDFITVTMSQHRMMQCPQCGWSIMVNETRKHPQVEFGFRKDMSLVGRCQGRCKKEGTNPRRRFKVVQYAKDSASDIVVKHWPIRELEFDFLEARNKLRVYWRIPARIKKLVLDDQDPDTIHDLDWAVLQAITQDKLLEFDDRVLFHAKEPMLSGLQNRGLGLPRTLALSRQHWLVQLLKKQCQALASAYVAPLEFFSLGQPNQMGFAGDPSVSVNMADFGNHIDEMLTAHKVDPTRKFFVPYPVNYQIAGGNANQFVPVQLMEMASRDLSNNLVPQAMLNGELTTQTSPIFVRMFEATNRPIPFMYNSFLSFFVDRVSELLKVEPVSAFHSPVSVEDNLGIDSMLQEGAAMGKNSDGAWMDRLGIDSRWERARQLAEMRSDLDLQTQVEKLQSEYSFASEISQSATPEAAAEAEAAAAGDPAAAGGAAPGPGIQLPSQGFTPSVDIRTMESEASAMASALLMLPPPQRQQELAVLGQNETAFHSLVTAALEDQRQQASMQARNQMFPSM